jgi:hypothetical protein
MNKFQCPKCNGSGRMPVPENLQRFKNVLAGYEHETDTLDCDNCGGQYMYTKPTGMVPANKNGEPCLHSYKGSVVGNCITSYTCEHCDDTYRIDTGD